MIPFSSLCRSQSFSLLSSYTWRHLHDWTSTSDGSRFSRQYAPFVVSSQCYFNNHALYWDFTYEMIWRCIDSYVLLFIVKILAVLLCKCIYIAMLYLSNLSTTYKWQVYDYIRSWSKSLSWLFWSGHYIASITNMYANWKQPF